MSPPTARYVGEWARFADWCTATDRTPLPASEEGVLAYLAEEQPAGGTAARWIAAIRAAHARAELADPCRGSVTAWVRRARAGRPTQLEALLAELAGPARRLPTTGWPVGMFGRRDRLAYLLHRLGPLPARALPRLSTDHLVRIEPGALTLCLDGTAMTIRPPLEDPVLCPACAAHRWLWVLDHAAVFARRPLAQRLATATPTDDHLCADVPARGQQQRGPAGWPLFPAIDRWGYLPLPPVPPLSLRTLEETLRTAGRSGRLRREAPVPRRGEEEEERHIELVPVPPPARRPGRTDWHRDGIQARARAQQSLAGVTDRLDALDAAADELAARTHQLLGGITEDPRPLH